MFDLANQPVSLWVGNLPIEMPNLEAELNTLFSKVGTVLSVSLNKDYNTKLPMGSGYVNFKTAEEGERAIADLNGTEFSGKRIRIVWNRHDKHHKAVAAAPENPDKPRTNIFIKNLRSDVTDEALTAHLAAIGTVKSLFLSPANHHPTKYALVSFETNEVAALAIEKLNDQVVPSLTEAGSKLFAAHAVSKAERLQAAAGPQSPSSPSQLNAGKNVYIKHLEDMSQQLFEETFAPFGKVVSAVIAKDPAGASRGFGFVCYDSKESAAAAIREMNGKVVSRIPLFVSLAQDKSENRGFFGNGAPQGGYNNGMGSHMMGGPGGMPMFNQRGGMGGMPHHSMQQNQFRGPPGVGGGFPPSQGSPFGHQNQMMMPSPFGGMPQRGGFGGGPMGMPQHGMRNNNMMSPFGGQNGPMQGGGGFNHMQHQQPRMMPHQHHQQQQRFTQQQPMQQQPPMQQQQRPVGITTNQLATMSQEQQKDALGHQLYSRINALHPQQAAKITGMLLELETAEILNVLDDPRVFQQKVSEAVMVLKQHEGAN